MTVKSASCTKRIEIVLPYLLIVEGKDEKLFFEALIENMNLTDIQIFPIGGKTKLKENLKHLVKVSPNFHLVTSLGIIRDANDSPIGAFQSVCDALKKVELPVPKGPLIPSTGPNPRNPKYHIKVNVFIMPDGNSFGDLEELCLRAVKTDPAMKCVVQYFYCLQHQGLSLPKQMSKAKVHVFLASRAEPDKRLGEAAKAGYWPWNHNAFEKIKNFLFELKKI